MTKKIFFSAVLLTAMGFLVNAKPQHEIRVTTSCGKEVKIRAKDFENTEEMLNYIWFKLDEKECKGVEKKTDDGKIE